MPIDVDAAMQALKRITITELRERYAEVFGEPTRSYNKQHLVKRIAWRLQAIREGDLSDRARRRAKELANDADLRLRPPASLACGEADTENVVVTSPFRVAPDDRLPMADLHERSHEAEQLMTELREQIVAAQRRMVSKSELDSALQAFDPVWETLSPREQARVMRLLIKRIDYDGQNGTVSITFHENGIKTLGQGASRVETEATA